MAENSDQDWPISIIFAEGSVTNGVNLSRFRRGGFQGLRAVEPNIIHYDWKNVHPSYAEGMGLELGLLIAAEMNFKKVTCTHYPIFIPNDYLFTEYAKTIDGHEKMEKWEIYAHALEDFIRTTGGFGTNTQPLREKVNYQKFVWGKTDEVTINGKTFYYPHRPNGGKKEQ